MPEQTILSGDMAVTAPPGQDPSLVIDVGNGRTFVVPLPGDTAAQLGKALLAPRVAVAENGRHG